MKREKVSSLTLTSVGYDISIKTLKVKFNNGGIYKYFDIPESVYNGLINASSHCGYFDSNVKKAGYNYTKVS